MLIDRKNGIEERKEYENDNELQNDLKKLKRDPTVRKITLWSGKTWERKWIKVKLIIPKKKRGLR